MIVERRSPDPLLPIDLLRNPLIARTLTVVFLVGMALFGAIAFIPLFVQGVMGATATQAGQVLTPLFMGWVIMSIASARFTVKLGYRVLAFSGSALMTVGFIGLSFVEPDSSRSSVLAAGLLIGSGMGLSMLSLLLAVQHGVARSHLGLATSLNQFSRSVGAAVGIAAMGALMTRQLAGVSIPGGVEGCCDDRDDAYGSRASAVRRRSASSVHRRHRSGGSVTRCDTVSAAGRLFRRRRRRRGRADAGRGNDQPGTRRRAGGSTRTVDISRHKSQITSHNFNRRTFVT